MTQENSFRIFFRGVKIDERTGDYIKKRLAVLEKLLDKILRVEVKIDLNKKGKFRAEVMVKTPCQLYRAEEKTESIEGSVDIVLEQLKVQIRKNKDRGVALRRRGGRSIKKKITLDKNARF